MSQSENGSFSKKAERIVKAQAKAARRALYRATSAGKTQMARELRKETGLSTAEVKKRLRAFSPKEGDTNARSGSLNIATKVGIQLSLFKPKLKKIKLPGVKKPGRRGRPKQRTFTGVTVKIGVQPRQIVPGGFLAKAKNGKELVLARKNQSDKTAQGRRPTVALRAKIVAETAERKRNEIGRLMASTLQKNYTADVRYYIANDKKR